METNVIYCGDCLKKLEQIPSESIDIIYIDPPFSSNRNYVAFWEEQEKRHFEDRYIVMSHPLPDIISIRTPGPGTCIVSE